MNDWINRIKFDESSPLTAQGQENKFGYQKHKPQIMETSHWHGHIEINYLFGCSAEYLIHGKKIIIPEGRMVIFWASIPHQMTNYEGDGYMVNIYIPLQAFLSWKFPSEFIDIILNGDVLTSDTLHPTDQPLTEMWYHNLERNSVALTHQVVDEIRNRIRRMSIESYSTYNLVSTGHKKDKSSLISGLCHIKSILKYIADHYDQKITVQDVAVNTGLHPNYAMKLFNQVMKIPIKQYINKLRLQHAQALLIDTNHPVLNIAMEAGFGSTSRFYDIFQREFHMTPLEFRQGSYAKAS